MASLQKLTLAFKATPLADVCAHLQRETGVPIAAGAGVADENVTLFCRQMPLRDVMRRIGRLFGFTWRRSGEKGAYQYELVQGLRAAGREEELRVRDRNAALLALVWEMERYRPFLHLSPDEALAQAATAPPDEQPLLRHLAAFGWGPIHLYFHLGPNLVTALRDGRTLYFSEEHENPSQRLTREIARGVIESSRQHRVIRDAGGVQFTRDLTDPRSVPSTTDPDVRAHMQLSIEETELGHFSFCGLAGCFLPDRQGRFLNNETPFATARSDAVTRPRNAVANARHREDPALSTRISAKPQSASSSKGTAADVIEALHGATGLPFLSDAYTRLYPSTALCIDGEPLFDALNRLGDAMRLRWTKDREWIRFRSASFFHDRRKEVPARLLQRWSDARRQQGHLTLHDLAEIAQLSDAQLGAAEVAEGAREQWGLQEWDLARDEQLQPHLRYLASFTAAQREAAMSPRGLLFSEMSLAHQQQFLSFSLGEEAEGLRSFEDLAGAALLVEYPQPGWYEWRPAIVDWFRWVIPGAPGRRALWSPIRERTPEAAMAAARRVDPRLLRAMLAIARDKDPRIQEGQFIPHASPILTARETPQILDAHYAPHESLLLQTELGLHVIYVPGMSHKYPGQVYRPGGTWSFSTTDGAIRP